MKRWQAALVLLVGIAAIAGAMYLLAQPGKALDPAEQRKAYMGE